MMSRMTVGIARFNFTYAFTAEDTPQTLLAQMRDRLALIPGLDVAANTFSIYIGDPPQVENPPMPEFAKVKGTIRSR